MNPLQLIHFFLQIIVDLQGTLEFQQLRLKPINNLLEMDHLVVSRDQFFILCISSGAKFRDGINFSTGCMEKLLRWAILSTIELVAFGTADVTGTDLAASSFSL
ncbi:hypothetical protein ACFX2I_046292 [Malus domestica]